MKRRQGERRFGEGEGFLDQDCAEKSRLTLVRVRVGLCIGIFL